MSVDKCVVRLLTACTVAAAILLGCGGKAQTPEELKAAVVSARDGAKAAQEKKDAKAARKAADAADEALGKLRKLADGKDADLASRARAALAEADAAAREARYFAELADEERRLADKLGSLKAKAYRTGRSVALTATFKGLALAAGQAAKKGIDGLPKTVRDAALQAAVLSGRAPLADGSPDWAGIAADMDARAKNPPENLAWFLAAGFLLSARMDLALYESESLDPAKAPALGFGTPKEDRLAVIAVRALAYRANGFTHLAIREFTGAAAVLEDKEPGAELGSEARAALHFFSALGFLYEKQLKRADREIMEAVRADPNGPLAVFLTGERLAAEGEYEKAAESLDAGARSGGGGDGWLAKRLSERAREIRDRKGGAEPLICDAGFVSEVALHYLGEAAGKSEPAKKLKGTLDSAGGFCTELLGRLPGGGKPDGEAGDH